MDRQKGTSIKESALLKKCKIVPKTSMIHSKLATIRCCGLLFWWIDFCEEPFLYPA
jgi:hypothetical protein